VKYGPTWEKKLKSPYRIKFDVRKPQFLESTLQRIEEMRLYSLVENLTISNTDLKAFYPVTYPG
jgi:hypothetical protein